MSTSLSVASGLSALAVSAAASAGFTSGNILVQRMGDGTTTLGSGATQVALQEFTTSGSAVQTIAMPTSGANQVTDSGSATSNGYFGVYNGWIGLGGYNAASGTASVASQNSKVTTVFGSDGSVASRTLYPTGGTAGTPVSPFSGNNYRSTVATGANTFYAAGSSSGSPSTGGVWYYDGSAFTQVSSTATGQPTNVRNLGIYGGQLYVASATGTYLGISSIGTGLPTGGNQAATLQINMGAGSSPYGFVLFDTNSDGSMDTAYIADDRTAAGGGLQKWTYTGGAWVQSWALLVNGAGAMQGTAATGFAGLRGLTGSFENGVATLYATTNETSNNRIVSIVDSGSAPTSATTLATAGANYVFRGVQLYSVPAPGAVALLGVAGLAAARRRRG